MRLGGAFHWRTVGEEALMQAALLELKGCTVDLDTAQVQSGSDGVRLSNMEIKLLRYLSDRPSQVVSNVDLLEQVWGYAASANTRTITITVGRLRAKIELDRKRPSHIITVIGEGYRFEPKPSVRLQVGRVRTNLTRPKLAFFGRADALADLDSHLDSGPLVTICAAGGFGKTRLALEYGQRALTDSRLALIWFRDLREAHSNTALLMAVSDLLGLRLPEAVEASNVERVGHALDRCGRMLLILDNFEQLPPTAAETVTRWIELAPKLKVIITSRHQLLVRDEQVLPLTPLSVEDAISLFAARAKREDTHYDISGQEEAVAELVQRLDLMPLAIELAAAWASMMSAEDILRRIDQRFTLLADDARQGHHATLRVALNASWDLLSPTERIALYQCSVFRGGFDLAAAEDIVQLPADAPWTPAVLRGLQHKSLLNVDETTQRFQLYESIQAYAEEALPDGESAPLRARHRAWYLARVETWGAVVARSGDAWARTQIDREFDNLLAVFHTSIAEYPDIAARVLLALEAYLERRGPVSAHLELLEQVLARPIDTALRIRALCHRAAARFGVSPTADVVADLDEALSLAGEIDDPACMARTRSRAASVLWAAGQPDRALRELELALPIHESTGDVEHRAKSLWLLGKARQVTGFHREGEQYTRRALALAEQESLATVMTDCHWLLGRVAQEGGRFDEALAHLESGRELAVSSGNLMGLAGIEIGLGDLTRSRGRLTEAMTHYEQAKSIYANSGNDYLASAAGIRVATVLSDVGRLDEAEAAFATELALTENVAVVNTAAIKLYVARIALERGHAERALSILADAREVLGDASAVVLGGIDGCDARAQHLNGHPEQAAAGFASVLDDEVVAQRQEQRFIAWRAAALADASHVAEARSLLAELAPVGDTELPLYIEIAQAHIELAEGRLPPDLTERCAEASARSGGVRVSLILLDKAIIDWQSRRRE